MQSRLTQLGLKDVFEKDSDGLTILHHACKEGKLQTVQHLIEYFPDLMKIRDKTGCSLLLISGLSGSVELVKHLISKGCNVTDKDNDGRTVLHKACKEGKLELAQYLVESYPDLLAIRDKEGRSPFLVAGFSGSVDLVKYLIINGCNVLDKDCDGGTVLHKACYKGRQELVQYLVENFPDMLTIRDKLGRSPFLNSGYSGSVELVKYLISKRCDVQDKDSNRHSVLYKACKVGRLQLVQYLVESYPDLLSIRDIEERSPFIVAGFSGSVELVKYLISKGCDISDMGGDGETILYQTCEQGQLELTQYLVETYPDVLTIRYKKGRSPFLVAGFSGSVELVKYLVFKGCDVLDKDSNRHSVLYKACNEGWLTLVQYLVETYPDLLKIRYKEGISPILVAGLSGSVELVQYLISKGCDKFDKDSLGRTVLHKACQEGKLELVQYLVENYPDMLTIRDKEGQSPLLVIGYSGSVELVKYLISKGFAVYDKDNDGRNLLQLQIACYNGKLELVQYLVESYPDMLTIRDNSGKSPFLKAGFSGSVELVKYLISRGCNRFEIDNRGWTILHFACQEGKLELVQYLVENYQDMLTIRNKIGQSPFIVTGFSGSVELVKYLISTGCGICDKDNNGRTILHYANEYEKEELQQFLGRNYPNLKPLYCTIM